MAAPAALAVRIDRDLAALLAELPDLPNVVAEWDSLFPATRASVAMDWQHLLADYLVERLQLYQVGAMTPDQCARYGDLRRQLRASLPLFERLGWLPLPVALKDVSA
jgi:hypothetical protein